MTCTVRQFDTSRLDFGEGLLDIFQGNQESPDAASIAAGPRQGERTGGTHQSRDLGTAVPSRGGVGGQVVDAAAARGEVLGQLT